MVGILATFFFPPEVSTSLQVKTLFFFLPDIMCDAVMWMNKEQPPSNLAFPAEPDSEIYSSLISSVTVS